jgi:DNA topoisomerase-1
MARSSKTTFSAGAPRGTESSPDTEPIELPDGPDVAKAAGLVYVSDNQPGFTRRRSGTGFSYRRGTGEVVTDRATRERIRALAIPPAWTDVWICANPRGHLQATGRDARGRKQYRYHPTWRAVRDAHKFDRLVEFGSALSLLRPSIEERLVLPGLPREKVLAGVVYLLDQSLVRVGNAEYANDNDTFGLTTLRADHVKAMSGHVRFRFVGKHNIEHDVVIDDPRVARLVRRCHELGGKDLFTYRDEDGEAVRVTSSDVNDFLHELVSPGISAKDFRTWGGSVVVTEALAEMGPAADDRAREGNVLEAIDVAAERLRNTRTVCRNCYVHPTIVDAYRDESLFDVWRTSRATRWLTRAERATLNLFEQGSPLALTA